MTESLWPQRWRPPDWVLIVVVVGMSLVVVGAFVAEYISEDRARERLLAAVSNASAVRVNGRQLEDPTVLLLTLRLIDRVPAHHSHPTTPVRIDLANGRETTSLVIARDSERPTEFWVFRPGPSWHGEPLGQAAGRITSTDLDNVLRREGL